MPDNYVKVLTALGMHSNKLKLSGRLTVEFELPEMKNPLCTVNCSLYTVQCSLYIYIVHCSV